MNQYIVQLIYEPILFFVMVIVINLLFKIYKYPFSLQLAIYSFMALLLIISLLITRLNKKEYEKEKVNYTLTSQILTVLIILITIGFIYMFI